MKAAQACLDRNNFIAPYFNAQFATKAVWFNY